MKLDNSITKYSLSRIEHDELILRVQKAFAMLYPSIPRNQLQIYELPADSGYADLYTELRELKKIPQKTKFNAGLQALILRALESPAGICLLLQVIPLIEMIVQGSYPQLTAHLREQEKLLFGQSDSWAKDFLNRLNAVRELQAAIADEDPTKPRCHPAPSAGWTNDPHGIIVDQTDQSFVIHYQENVYAASWGCRISWGKYRLRANGEVVQLPTTLSPVGLHHPAEHQPDHYYSGSIAQMANPDNPEIKEHVAFISAVSSNQTFWKSADTYVRTCKDPQQDIWSDPIRVTDKDSFPPYNYQGKELLDFRDVRDPYVTEIDGQIVMLLAGRLATKDQRLENRTGRTVIFTLVPSDTTDYRKPWVFHGLSFFNDETVSSGAPGIIECPSLVRTKTDQGSQIDLLMFSQMREKGPIKDRFDLESIELLLGNYNAHTAEFVESQRYLLDYSANIAAYASTMVNDPDGQTVTIIYWVKVPGNEHSWAGMHSLRTLYFKDGRPQIRPHASILNLCKHDISNQAVERKNSLSLRTGRQYYLRTTVDLHRVGEDRVTLKILATQDGLNYLPLHISKKKITVGDGRNIIPVPDHLLGTKVELEIVVDHKLIEVYFAGCVLTYIYNYTPEELAGDPKDYLLIISQTTKRSLEDLQIFQLKRCRADN